MPTRPRIRRLASLAVSASAILLFAGNCTLGPLQAFLIQFTVDDLISAGETQNAHKAFYPVDVKLAKHFVRISGQLDTLGEAPPARVTLIIAGENQTTGKKNQKITLKLNVESDGSFTAIKKIKKDIPAGTIQTISATPVGADIPAGSEVRACIDIAKKKGDLAPASDCQGATAVSARIVEVFDDSFVPKSLVIKAGDTVRWVLRGAQSNHTTAEMNSTWNSGFVLLNRGDFFEHTFTPSAEGQTFMYSCVSHKSCCQMQGSIRVGESAPPPDDGY